MFENIVIIILILFIFYYLFIYNYQMENKKILNDIIRNQENENNVVVYYYDRVFPNYYRNAYQQNHKSIYNKPYNHKLKKYIHRV